MITRIQIYLLLLLLPSCKEVSNHPSKMKDNKHDEYKNVKFRTDSTGLTYIWQINEHDQTEGYYIVLDSIDRLKQKGFFVSGELQGYMSYYSDGSLVQKRSFMNSLNTPALQEWILYDSEGNVDSSNSCFIDWNVLDANLLPVKKGIFHLKGRVTCPKLREAISEYRILKYSDNEIDSIIITREEEIEIFLNLNDSTNEYKVGVEFIEYKGSDKEMGFMHEWVFRKKLPEVGVLNLSDILGRNVVLPH